MRTSIGKTDSRRNNSDGVKHEGAQADFHARYFVLAIPDCVCRGELQISIFYLNIKEINNLSC